MALIVQLLYKRSEYGGFAAFMGKAESPPPRYFPLEDCGFAWRFDASPGMGWGVVCLRRYFGALCIYVWLGGGTPLMYFDDGPSARS